jgi:hypothetical protein
VGSQPSPEQATPQPEREAVTQLLKKLSGGDKEAFDRLIPLVYDQLRHVASRSLRSERSDHTLRATALVHEAYLRLADANGEWQDRVHFYAVAARAWLGPGEAPVSCGRMYKLVTAFPIAAMTQLTAILMKPQTRQVPPAFSHLP